MCALSSADRVPGYEPVGQRFESSRARHKNSRSLNAVCYFYCMYCVFEPPQIPQEFDSFCVWRRNVKTDYLAKRGSESSRARSK